MRIGRATRFEPTYRFARGTVTRDRSHENDSRVGAPAGSKAMTNCSTGSRKVSTRASTRTRSCAGSYTVPHCPVCLLIMSFQPVGLGSVHSVYFPGGTVALPTTRLTVVFSWVAALAPVRH